MSGVRRFAGAPVERPSMTRIPFLSTCALAGLLLTAPAAWAQSANDSYAWIDPPVAKHTTAVRRRELTLLHAARLAEERGYTHVELMLAPDTPAVGGVEADEWKLTDSYGNVANSIYPPHLTPSPIHRRGAVLVRFCNESVESCPGVRAHRILLNLRP